MTHQKQTPTCVKTQIENLVEDVRLLGEILTKTTDTNKKILIQEIIDAKLKLKRKKQNALRPIRYGFLIAIPLILCVLFIDVMSHGPQYLMTIKGLTSNVPIVFISAWVFSGIFKDFNRVGQVMLESKIEDLERQLYGINTLQAPTA